MKKVFSSEIFTPTVVNWILAIEKQLKTQIGGSEKTKKGKQPKVFSNEIFIPAVINWTGVIEKQLSSLFDEITQIKTRMSRLEKLVKKED